MHSLAHQPRMANKAAVTRAYEYGPVPAGTLAAADIAVTGEDMMTDPQTHRGHAMDFSHAYKLKYGLTILIGVSLLG